MKTPYGIRATKAGRNIIRRFATFDEQEASFTEHRLAGWEVTRDETFGQIDISEERRQRVAAHEYALDEARSRVRLDA